MSVAIGGRWLLCVLWAVWVVSVWGTAPAEAASAEARMSARATMVDDSCPPSTNGLTAVRRGTRKPV